MTEWQRYILFIWKPSEYELAERQGRLSERGDEIELGEEGSAPVFVSKIGPSPLPGDDRPCAYLQEV